MVVDLLQILSRFADLRVLAIGDVMLDSYLQGETGRLCREAPVPVVALAQRRDLPGGAANTAANLQALGARVSLLAAVGDDVEGRLLRQSLRARRISPAGVVCVAGRRTLVKSRVIAGGHMLVRFDQGDSQPLPLAVEDQLVARLRRLYRRCDAVVVSDYGCGVLTPRVIAALVECQQRCPRILLVDSRHNLRGFREAGVTAIKPNFEETLELLELPSDTPGLGRVDLLARQGAHILDLTGAQCAALTLDSEGSLLFERDAPPYRTYGRAVSQFAACGAGDTFASAFALALAAGAPAPAAAEIASAAAAITVGKQDTAVCEAQELRDALSGEEKLMRSVERLLARVVAHRELGRRIVFTNGCFDILHRGHIAYLSQAKATGDVLIIGVNTDESIARLKGPGRPINPLEDRVQVLSALSAVDHIIPFAEATPCDLIRALRPDVFVKGGDYTREQLPEAEVVEECGGRVVILPYLDNRSTTRLIERIQRGEGPALASSTSS